MKQRKKTPLRSKPMQRSLQSVFGNPRLWSGCQRGFFTARASSHPGAFTGKAPAGFMGIPL